MTMVARSVGMSVDLESPETFAEWVGPHVESMAHLASRLVPQADRDDVVQESLTRAWQKRRQYDPARGTPRAWLCAITFDQARRWRRRPAGQPALGVLTTAAVRDVEGSLDVTRAVAFLPDRQRLAVNCFYYVGLSTAETAAVMGCSEGTVKSTLAAARTSLGQRLRGGA